MADLTNRIKRFDSVITGDCEADPVPALWDQDEDYITDAGLLEKLWIPVAVVVIAGWAGLTFFMFNAFGWWAVGAMFGVVVVGAGAALALVKSGSRADEASNLEFLTVTDKREITEERSYRKAA